MVNKVTRHHSQRDFPFNNFNTELHTALAQGLSLTSFIRNELESAMNQMLQSELTIFLDYEQYDPIGYNSGNSLNRSYTRTVKTKYGDVHLTIPRDRIGAFNQQTIPPYKCQTDDLETTILQLYSKRITTSEIADLIEKMYGHAYTPQTVSSITQVIEHSVSEFHQRPPSKRYIAIYGEATYLNVHRDSFSKEVLDHRPLSTEKLHAGQFDSKRSTVYTNFFFCYTILNIQIEIV